jgi:hypothetical protein
MSMPTRLRPVVLAIGALLVAGCSFVTPIRENADGGSSSTAVAARISVVQTSGGATFAVVRLAILSAGAGRRATVSARRGL